jgi:hypothetical protein
MRWEGHAACVGAKRNAYSLLVGMSEEKGPLGKPRHRWKDNIKTDLRKTEWGHMDWNNLAQDMRPVVGSCEQSNEFHSVQMETCMQVFAP